MIYMACMEIFEVLIKNTGAALLSSKMCIQWCLMPKRKPNGFGSINLGPFLELVHCVPKAEN